MPAPTFQFSLRVEAATEDPFGPEAVEEFALELRQELEHLEVTRIDRIPGGPAPEGTRALEVVAALELLVTAVQAGEALTKIVRALRRVAERYAQRRRAVRVVIAGTEVDLAAASQADLERVVQSLLARPATARTGTRSALVIANARYDDPTLAQLRSPGHDAEALVRVLNDPAIGGFQAEALVDADERTIRRRIAAFFAGRDRDDVLLLHFSCHGVKDARGRLHLAARDTDLAVLGATSIPASFINDQLAETQSRRVVLVLDCCYSGAFARGVAVRAEDTVHIADEFGAGSGRIVLTASSATEYSFEDGELTRSQGRPSAFTGALVHGLETGEADLDSDGEISVDELYDYTYREVRDSTPGQAPMKWSFGVEGSLVVARSVRPAALPAAILDDLASDRVVLRLEGVHALAGLVRDGRAGQRASARAKLESLRDNDDSVRVRAAAAGALGGVPETVVPQAKPAPAPKPPPPPEPVRVPGRPAVATAAALLLFASALCYGVAIAASTQVTPPGVLATLLIVVPYGTLAVLGFARWRGWWSGVVAGLLAWEWLVTPTLGQQETLDHLPVGEWITLAVGNSLGLAALVCAIVDVVRHRSRAPRGAAGRVVQALIVSAFAVPLSRTAIDLFYLTNGIVLMDDGQGQRLAAALACAAVAGLMPLVAPAWTVWAGWLLGGALTTLRSTILYYFAGHTYDSTIQVIDAALLGGLLVTVLLIRRFGRAPSGG
jgi:hypothetical protein